MAFVTEAPLQHRLARCHHALGAWRGTPAPTFSLNIQPRRQVLGGTSGPSGANVKRNSQDLDHRCSRENKIQRTRQELAGDSSESKYIERSPLLLHSSTRKKGSTSTGWKPPEPPRVPEFGKEFCDLHSSFLGSQIKFLLTLSLYISLASSRIRSVLLLYYSALHPFVSWEGLLPSSVGRTCVGRWGKCPREVREMKK